MAILWKKLRSVWGDITKDDNRLEVHTVTKQDDSQLFTYTGSNHYDSDIVKRVENLEKRVEQNELSIENLKAKLLGTPTQIGMLQQMQGEVTSVYKSLGNIEAQLFKIRKALT